MNYAVDDHAVVDDLVIDRHRGTVTKITKSGVVLWPAEPHNAPMAQEPLLTSKQEFELRKAMEAEQSGRANGYMIGGNHYQRSDATGTCSKCGSTVQHWDWAHNLRGLEYAATKYIARWRDKGGLDSLKKAIHYIQKLIEIHFPDVSVNISFTNRLGESGGSGDGKAAGCEGLAKSQTPHQAAVDMPLYNYNGDRVR